ncbi:hypothetical protein A2U01_0034595, partial [Trifolium medium]|nr:hypothetical protein [Trifolium medium]
FSKEVTNFLKICLIDFGMTCAGKELVKDAAKIPEVHEMHVIRPKSNE